MTRPPDRRIHVIAALLALALLALGFPALDTSNVTWDAALGDLFFGQRYLSYFTSFDARYLDFAADPYPPGHQPDLTASPFRSRPWEYYPVANIVGAASSVLFSRWLGWLDPFDGFQAMNLGFGLLLVLVWFPFLARRLGLLAATTGILLLFTAPRLAGDLLSNPKDYPSMALFTVALAAFASAWERGSPGGVVGAGALWGLALATKANALFLPLVVVGTIAWGPWPEGWRGRGRTLLLALVGAGLAGTAVLVGSWPYLWADPVGRLGAHLSYLLTREQAMAPGSHASALAALAWTTPLPFLLAVALGLGPLVRRLRAGDRLARLLVVWIGVVLARLHLPGAVNFDGVRHFLELFPPLAAVGGLGLAAAARFARARVPSARRGRALAAALVAVPLLAQVAALAAVHPFGTTYWNELVGGLGGAQARGLPQAGDYWGASYRQGLAWLSAHAEPGSALAVPIAEHAVRLVAPVRLRADIDLLPLTSPARPGIPPPLLDRLFALAAARPVYVMTVRRDDWDNALTRFCRDRLVPVAEWRRQGGTVLAIYRLPPAGGR
jgi:hypothetical protein